MQGEPLSGGFRLPVLVLSLVLGAAVVASLALAGVCWRRLPSGVLHNRTRRQVIVTLKTGGSFQGVLYEHDSRCLVLRNAEAIGEPPSPHVPVDGELLALWADVLYVQLP